MRALRWERRCRCETNHEGPELSSLSGPYVEALATHITKDMTGDFEAAHVLGGHALALGLETLDLAKVHHESMEILALRGTSITDEEILRRAAAFFEEALMPIERTHRTALESDAGLSELRATLSRYDLEVTHARTEVQKQVAGREAATQALKASEQESARLLEVSRRLQLQLQALARDLITFQEDERRKLSLTLQDEIAQNLLGIQVRMLALKKEVTVSNEDFAKEIAITQRVVRESVRIISRFTREAGLKHEE